MSLKSAMPITGFGYILLLTFHFSLFTFIVACGSRGDPKPPDPHREVGVVKDLRASRRDDGIYLTWRIPREKDFPVRAIKGFVILRAEVPDGVRVEDANYLSKDFIVPGKGKVFEYIDKDITMEKTYAYKIVTMDKNARMSRDSKIAIVIGKRAEIEKREVYLPPAPTGLIALYAPKSIILTWDEVSQVRLYRVYRSISMEGFVLVGETVTPAFTDRDVEPSKRYYYRVTAVGQLEGHSSGVIEVTTEVH